MGIYIYATPAWKWKSHHPNKFKWPTNKTWSHPCPGKRWCLETGAALATIRRTGHTPRICLAVGIWLKSWRMKSPIPKRFFVFFFGGRTVDRIDIHTYQGKDKWYIRMVSTASLEILWPLPCLKSLTRNRKLHWNPIFPARMSTLSHHCSHCWKRILGFLEGWEIKHLAQLVHIFRAIHIYTDPYMWIGMWDYSPFDQFSWLPLS